MSWDVLLQKFPPDAERPEQVPDDYLPPAIGSRVVIAAAVLKLFRGADYDGESCISVDRAAFAMEVRQGSPEIRGTPKAKRKAEVGSRRKLDQEADRPKPPLEYLPGVVKGKWARYIYLSFLPGESPKQQQKSVFRGWLELAKEHADLDAGISGPRFVLTLPDGETFGDIQVRRLPVFVTETEAEMIPRVEQGAALVYAFAAATGRRSGEIEGGSEFVRDDGQRIPLAQCSHCRLETDADYARKVKGRKTR